MQKCWFFNLITVSAILVLLTLSCSMDLEPAKSGTTTVALSIGTLIPPANAMAALDPIPGRAVAPDFGYLYIRTVGGPTGANGPFYGPYKLTTGKTFTTTDIPAGSYKGIAFMYATVPLDTREISYLDSPVTFRDLMSVSDAEFIEMTNGGQVDPIGELVAGYASAEIVNNVTILANRINPITVTLVPVCSGSSIDLSNGPTYSETGNQNAFIRKFIAIEGIQAPSGQTVSTITCTVPPPNGSLSIGKVQIFNEFGKLVKSFPATGPISQSTPFAAPWTPTDGDTAYLYIEYQGQNLGFTFEATLTGTPPASVTIAINNLAGAEGQKVFALLFPDEYSNPVAYAVFTLTETGTGSAELREMGKSTPYSAAARTWAIGFFVDLAENYSDMDPAIPLQDFVGIEQHYNDLIYQGEILTNGTPATHTCINANVNTSNTHVYYVSEYQSGIGGGQRIQDSMGYGQFIDLLTNVSSGNYEIKAYILESFTLYSSPLSVLATREVKIVSLDPTDPQTLTLQADSSFTVENSGNLTLQDIILNGYATNTSPLITVEGSLFMKAGAVLQNNVNTQTYSCGGVLVNSGGTFTMKEGLISNCDTTENTSCGGVLVGSSGIFSMEGGTITECNGSVGGGVNLKPECTFTMTGKATISECTALVGGGIYAAASPGYSISLTINGGTIKDCDSTENGGGVYAEGVAFTFQSGTIDHCSSTGAGYHGGGLVLELGTVFTHTAGIITNCSAYQGGGIAYNHNLSIDTDPANYSMSGNSATNPSTENFYMFY